MVTSPSATSKRVPNLPITYVGYKSQTLTWSGSPLNITLQDDANMLEETVVIGYGTVKKADLAGSVAVLDSKNFKDQPVARVEDALNGRMSGVQVMSSGVPGGSDEDSCTWCQFRKQEQRPSLRSRWYRSRDRS